MSLHAAAQHIAQKGRGRDKMLVHMTPREVQGLQALAKAKGGSLATNPDTGLPEAGFLEDILPIVAAGAATYFTAGAAAPMLVSAGMGPTTAAILAGAGSGALIGGASSAIQGQDFGRGALMGGLGGALAGGMGAFGGAPGGDVSASQLVSEPNAMLAEASKATAAAPVQPLSVPADVAATGGAPAVPANQPYNPNALVTTPPGTPAQAMTPGPNQAVNPETGDIYTKMAAQQPGAQTAQTGKGGIGDWWNKQSDWEKAGYTTAGALGLAALNAPPGQLPTNAEEESILKRISPNFRAQAPVRPNPYYRAQYPVYAASGGIVALANGGGPVERMTSMNTSINPQGGLYPQGMIDKTQYATPSQRPASMEILESEPSYQKSNPLIAAAGMARGGIADLGGYSDGGRMLKGPGDGMSDSIPGVIGGKQPARLADGEFVVPADVVSHLGNGSTDAGARKLYAMMDRVRQARTGKKKQAPAVKTDKFIPRMA
jgi:hypothetical protein